MDPNSQKMASIAASIAKKKRKNKKKTGAPVNKAIEAYKKAQKTQSSSEDESGSSDEGSDTGSGSEGKEGYKKGGYHPVKLGEVYNERYKVIEKLGWGHFSTVWLTEDLQTPRYAALKIVKSAKHYTEAAQDEIKLLQTIASGDAEDKKCCVKMLDSFEHTGPHGKHVCMVFEVLGSNLLDLIKRYNYRGIPIPIVKSLCKNILTGLDYLHRECKILHTDLKPENVLLHYSLPKVAKRKRVEDKKDASNVTETQKKMETEIKHLSITSEDPTHPVPAQQEEKQEEKKEEKLPESSDKDKPSHIVFRDVVEEDPSSWHCKIADFGNGCWEHQHFTDDIQTRQYRAPEVILGSKYGPSCDMWSMGCMVFELATGDLLFEPKTGKNFDKNDDHLAQMMELLGVMPKKLAMAGKFSRDFFTRHGELKHIANLNFWPLESVLMEKYKWTKEEAKGMSDFILPMLEFYPERRATAETMLKHAWLEHKVVVPVPTQEDKKESANNNNSSEAPAMETPEPKSN